MKKVLIIPFLVISCFANAQFVIQGTNTMTIQAYTLVSIDGLILNPASDLTLSDNALERSITYVPINSGNTIHRIYHFSNPILYSGTLGFKYDDAEMAGNTEDGLNIVTSEESSGDDWIIAPEGSVYTDLNLITTSVIGANLRRITATSDGGLALSLTLKSFNGRCDNNDVICTWDIADASQVEKFILEQSNDAQNWYAVSHIPFVTTTAQYSATVPASSSSFFRLRIVDFDGSVQVSHIVKTDCYSDKSNFTVFPSPATDIINLVSESPQPNSYLLTITDARGMMQQQQKWNTGKGANTLTLKIDHLVAGLYYIVLTDAQGSRISINKFVKL